MKKNRKLLYCLIVLPIIIGCVFSNPLNMVQQQQALPADDSWEVMYDLLSYIPANIVEDHPPYFMNVWVTYLDFEQMHRQLNIPEVGPDASREEKTEAARAYRVQGIPAFPDDLFMYDFRSYEEYGWDFTHVDQSLMMVPFDTAILKGEFDVEKIDTALMKMDYEISQLQNFALYTSDYEKYCFAVSEQLIIVSPDPKIVTGSIYQGRDPNNSAAMNENVRQLVENTHSPFGFLLLSSGDLSYMEVDEFYRYKIPYFEEINTYRYEWELMMISYEADEDTAELQIDYAFPSSKVAEVNVASVEDAITNTPYLINVDYQTWEDAMQVKSIEQDENLIQVIATTQEKDLIGDSFILGNFFGLLPARKVTEDF